MFTTHAALRACCVHSTHNQSPPSSGGEAEPRHHNHRNFWHTGCHRPRTTATQGSRRQLNSLMLHRAGPGCTPAQLGRGHDDLGGQRRLHRILNGHVAWFRRLSLVFCTVFKMRGPLCNNSMPVYEDAGMHKWSMLGHKHKATTLPCRKTHQAEGARASLLVPWPPKVFCPSLPASRASQPIWPALRELHGGRHMLPVLQSAPQLHAASFSFVLLRAR